MVIVPCKSAFGEIGSYNDVLCLQRTLHWGALIVETLNHFLYFGCDDDDDKLMMIMIMIMINLMIMIN